MISYTKSNLASYFFQKIFPHNNLIKMCSAVFEKKKMSTSNFRPLLCLVSYKCIGSNIVRQQSLFEKKKMFVLIFYFIYR